MKKLTFLFALFVSAFAWAQEADSTCFADAQGYRYRMRSDGGCMLARGGSYEGVVELPATVSRPDGVSVPVKGIEAQAFMDSRKVSQVKLASADQVVEPGAYAFTSIPYSWDALLKPRYAYPDESLKKYVTPTGKDEKFKGADYVWAFFKQNYAPVACYKDQRDKDDLKIGMAWNDFNQVEGVYYSNRLSKKEIAKMFKGYDPIEVELLLLDKDFAAFHTFPSYSRWKYPEREIDTPSSILDQISKRYGRKVLYGHRAAALRDGTARFDIVELEHKDKTAMVVFVWSSQGEILSVGEVKTELTPGDEGFSVWNVDDDGFYGIPDVVSIAQAPDGAVILFLAKNSPESVHCFALRQVGDRFEEIEFDCWYRYLD